MQLKDEEKMLLLLKLFQMQNDTQKMTVNNNKKMVVQLPTNYL